MCEINVPNEKLSQFIGNNGETIRELKRKSGAEIVTVQKNPKATTGRLLRIYGNAESVKKAKELIRNIQNKGDDRVNIHERVILLFSRGRGCGRRRTGFQKRVREMRPKGRGLLAGNCHNKTTVVMKRLKTLKVFATKSDVEQLRYLAKKVVTVNLRRLKTEEIPKYEY